MLSTMEDKLVAAYQAGAILARAAKLDDPADTDLEALKDAFETGYAAVMAELPLDPEPWAYNRKSKSGPGPWGTPDRSAERWDTAMMWFPREGYEQDGDKYP